MARAGQRIATALLAAALLCVAAAPAHAEPSYRNPPPGANDFDCRPSPVHPNPVVLLHGLSANTSMNWDYPSPLLVERGYCVFALTYGLDPRVARYDAFGGVIPIEQSAPEIAAFVDTVLAATGAEKVDLVGHSEGTYTPQYWLKFLGGAPKVDRYVAWTPLYDGTTLGGVDQARDFGHEFGISQPVIDAFDLFCGFCPQAIAGSPMQRKLSAGGHAAPGVTYTTVMTRYDELVIP